ncbi:unnamed protein product [Trichogramma brassicae]|uniref:Gelsolin-like domain-containing protein n=1 Tax=Trichogramma brassicae TaxID=86971 RepID=A0A6H5IDK1_9HYME|nr:unnamed protein product [Trichogramma brassicae]
MFFQDDASTCSDESAGEIFKSIPKGRTAFCIWKIEVYRCGLYRVNCPPSWIRVAKDLKDCQSLRAIHFWVGEDCEADTSGAAALRAVELDSQLACAVYNNSSSSSSNNNNNNNDRSASSTQSSVACGAHLLMREAQGRESPRFLGYFRHREFLTVEYPLHDGDDGSSCCRLHRVSGTSIAVLTELRPVDWASFSSHDVILLDVPSRSVIFLWLGSTCEPLHKRHAARLIDELLKLKQPNQPRVLVLEDGYEQTLQLEARRVFDEILEPARRYVSPEPVQHIFWCSRVLINMFKNESSVSYNSRKYLEVYGKLSKDVKWKIQEDRREFLHQLDAVINKWKGQLPNLLDFFRKEVIYWLLMESVTCAHEGARETPGKRFIDFVARSGYKDEPDKDKDGKPLLHRTTPIHRAAKLRAHLAIISDLFKIYDKFDVNYIDEHGLTHFHVACGRGLDTIVEKFLELGQDPNDGFPQDTTARYSVPPLFQALHNGQGTVAELLLRCGADPNLVMQNGDAPLHTICNQFGDDDDGELLEKFFAINDQLGNSVKVNAQDKHGDTPLHLALMIGIKNAVELLLRRGADPNLANAEGFTPAHFICSIDLVETFFKINDEQNQTIQINARNIEGYTPLHSHLRMTSDQKKAVIERKHETVQEDAQDNEKPPLHLILDMMNGCKKTAEALLRRGADPNIVTGEGQTGLHIICSNDDDDDMAEMLFEICDEIHQIVEVDARDNEGWTPLHAAIFNGNINLVEVLLRRGANPNLADKSGYTPLHFVCLREDDDDNMAKMLFAICEEKHQTVQVDARDNEGRTPLLVAIHNGKINLVEFLLRRGARPDLADDNKVTPLHAICERKNGDDGLAKKFFEINDELSQLVEVGAKNKEGSTPLHLALSHGCKKLNELLLKRYADLNLTNAEGRTPLHVICQREDDDADLLNMLFEMGEKFNKPIQVDARDEFGYTALHLALIRGHEQMAEWLLRRGADLNLANALRSTPLHLISEGKKDYADLLKTFFEISDEQTRPVNVDTRDSEGQTPLHYAISHRHKKVFELLLRRNADPNLADNDGSTALHTICMADDDDGWAKMLFEISEEKNKQVQIDARGMNDFTPLHHALVNEELREVAELLLRKGAATNLVDREGSTPLHTVCEYADDEDRVRMLIEISNEENKPVVVDARDKLGRTPLHLALARGNGQVVKYLLKLGADPNLADENGFSPLHVVSKDLYDDAEFLTLFCDVSKEVNRPLQLDAQDKNGRTPLQWAVANLFLNVVDVLVDQGADLSSFVFPSKSFFAERFGSISEMDERERPAFKLWIASKIVTVVERLEKRGYEFDRSNTLDIMSLFAEFELFEKSTDLEETWCDDEEFVSKSKEIMVNSSLSLHYLIRLRPEEAAKQLKNENYIELANKLADLPESYQEACAVHLCEIISRGFFWPWALDAFYELQRYQLPILCCEMSIANLQNEDLYNICLASILP